MSKKFNWKYTLENKILKLREKNMLVYTNKKDCFASGLCFTKLFYLFFIGCFLGTVFETLWYLLLYKKFEICVGLVYGPFIPVYGFGACLITVLLYKMYKFNDLVIFIVGTVFGAGFEFLCSAFQEKAFGTVAWSYNGTPLNIGGRTNLMYGMIWGLLGILWLRWIYPLSSNLIEKIPLRFGKVLTFFLVIFMISNVVISYVAAERWNQRNKKIAAENSFEEYVDENFDDEFMKKIFPHTRFVT